MSVVIFTTLNKISYDITHTYLHIIQHFHVSSNDKVQKYTRTISSRFSEHTVVKIFVAG